ncbi:MAG: tetratricopeptide repeat protein, partial [Planctomycetota bacterium]|nr:tetratricopeptide repeat protein [Planctomycetota bacterium]
ILLALLIAKGAELMQRARKISLWVSRIKLPKPIDVGQIFGVLVMAGILAFYSAGTIRRTADWKEPLRFWEKTFQSNPNYWRAQVNLGLAYLYENRTEAGIQILEKALPLAPEAPKIYFSLGFAYEMQGNIEKSTAAFEKGIMTLTSSDIDKAYLNPHIRRIMPRIKESDLKYTEFVWGSFYQMRGLKEKAIGYYKKSLDIYPAHAETHYSLAQIYEDERQYNQAIFHYQQVIKAEPEHWGIDKVYFNLGKIYRLRGEPDKALTYWEKAVEIKPDFLEARANLAELYKERGMYSEAIGHYKKAVEIVPKNWDVYFNLGLLYAKQGLPKEAAEYYEKAVQCNPNFAEAHYRLGLLYLDFGRFDDAANLFQRIMYLDPTDMRAKKMYEVALKSAKQIK